MQQDIRNQPQLDSMVVSDAMRQGVISCPREAALPTIAAIMVTHGIHAVVVASLKGGTPLVVTDLELVRAAVDRGPDAQASDLAREPIAKVPADSMLSAAVELMAVQYVTHVLVTDPGSGDPAGIVSSLDIAAVVGGVQPRLARLPRPAPARPSPSATRLSDATVRDVMHPGVVTCTPHTPLPAVARMMADHRVHCVAVAGIDSSGEGGQHLTWGLIADIDLVLAAHGHALDSPAAAIAATAPLAVQEGESLERTAMLMAEHDASHVVVVGSGGLPSGMVSTLDVAAITASRARS